MFNKFSVRKRKTCVRLNEDLACKICLGSDSSSPVIHPCKCQGSIYYVHQDCLKSWILSNYTDIGEAKCELCHHKYSMKYSIGLVCDVNPSSCSHRVLCLIFKLIMLFISLILMFCLTYKYSDSETAIDLGEAISLTLIGIVIFLVFAIIVFAVLKLVLVKKLKKWEILEYSRPDFNADAEIPEVKIAELNVPERIQVEGIEADSPLLNVKVRRVKTEERETECNKVFNSTIHHSHDNDDFSLLPSQEHE